MNNGKINSKIKPSNNSSKFWTTKCRTTDISKFKNSEY